MACTEVYDNLQSISDITRRIHDLVHSLSKLGVYSYFVKNDQEAPNLPAPPTSLENFEGCSALNLSMDQTLGSLHQDITFVERERHSPARTIFKRKAVEPSPTLLERPKERKKKRQKLKDEIDDIFGSELQAR
ncbi:hypothetical protein H0H87_000056 [Tephrocybe sp. NHM501043]|nr:hypothetical protein H0H87_000056 [Tephrocybe sp. NHM501043]